MADDTFRPRRPQTPQDDDDQVGAGEENEGGMSALNMAEKMRQQAAGEEGHSDDGPKRSGNGNFNIKGMENAPPEFMQALKAAQGGPQKVQREMSGKEPKRGFGQMSGGGEGPGSTPAAPVKKRDPISSSSGHLKELLEGLKGSTTIYEEIELPSRGRFYDDTDGPANGVVSIRPMTGEEEQILATPRFVRKGQAINMIFQRCLKEQFRPEQFLTIDRTYMLIYLRGISYSPNYDVEVKCPECEKKFGTTIDLNTLYVEPCPENYGPTLQDVLPTTKLPFSYRLSTGRDEQEITDYRDRRIKAFGDASADDTLIYRTSMLLDNIDGLTNKGELQILLKNLPISDVSYIRNCINEPPFGVDTNVEIVCPSCLQDFEVDLPLEANFFFPRRKKTKTQA
jgi:hypothetical protein